MDFYRISRKPSIVGLNEVTFQDKLRLTVKRASILKTLAAQSLPQATDPGSLKSEEVEGMGREVLKLSSLPYRVIGSSLILYHS